MQNDRKPRRKWKRRLILGEKPREKFSDYVQEFQSKYADSTKGQKHMADYDRERTEVRGVFEEIRAKRSSGKDITDDVLYRLLPYDNNKYNREHGHRISTWPAIQKDIKIWHENARWQVPENWPRVANAILDLVLACERGPEQSDFEHFSGLAFIKGFEAGMLSPIFYCIRPELLIINSKSRDTVNYLYALFSRSERIDNFLINYLGNIGLINKLLVQIDEPMFARYDVFDMFCHYMCDKRPGGYARAVKLAPIPTPPIEEEIIPIIEEAEGTPKEQRSHDEVQWMLIHLGRNLGCDVWIARNDQGKSFKGKAFSDLTLANLPRLGFDQDTTRIVEYIDVIWLKGNAIIAAFEIEHTTSIYSGILRLADLITMQPNVNVDLFIVAENNRYDKVMKELNRPTFRSYALKLHELCKFVSYEAINELLRDTTNYAGFMEPKVIQKVAK